MDLRDARFNTVKELRCLHEVANLSEISNDIEAYDEKDTFKNVIHRLFEDYFAEDLAEIDAYDEAQERAEAKFWESANRYLQAKDGKDD